MCAANNKSEGIANVLAGLAGSGHQVVQLCTLALVTISGFSNFFQTENLSKQSLEDRDRAVRQIHLLYERVDSFEQRQKQSLQNQEALLENERKILEALKAKP